ncbi:MAG: hypothetical protein LBP78_08410 [Acidaminococcales bacterium]|nr:hypothetical protein [Acidaminococcales bacterium]
MIKKFLILLKSLVETILAWCVGFLLTGCLFATLIFYIIPFFSGIPLNADKYISKTFARIDESKKYTEEPPEPVIIEESRPLSETIIESIDKAADNLIHWINEPKE